ncbi:MAG: hypothetical protein AAGF67_18760, partial [Verrucomicrobiota bacterium]
AVWLLFQYLPLFGDWLGEKADDVVGTQTDEEIEEVQTEVPPPEPVAALVETETEQNPDGSPPIQAPDGKLGHFRSQLVEQLGGDSVVTVRHLALSDDESRMVAAIAWKDGREPALAEIFFERDEFGRYLSSDDAAVKTQIKLWSD